MKTGRQQGEIQDHGLQSLGKNNTPCVMVKVQIDGDYLDVPIWLTDKSAGIARQQLKMCGFDVDSRKLTELESNPTLLSGNVVPVDVEQKGDYMQGSFPLPRKADETLDAAKIQNLENALRNAKHRDEDEEPPHPAEEPPI